MKKIALLAAAFATPAFAHHPMGGATPSSLSEGLLSGFGHPIIGLDHFAFLLIAACLCLAVKAPARYLVAIPFVLATAVGTFIHLQAADIPYNEVIVALTVLVAGVLAIGAKSLSVAVLAVLFAAAGIFHGYAYGEAIVGAENTVLAAYLIGFAAIQYVVITGLSLLLNKFVATEKVQQVLVSRVGGIAAALVGLFFLQANLV